ncbi:MAG: hypothetical protein ACT4NY_07285 [Pseudonocardiales bacterium]
MIGKLVDPARRTAVALGALLVVVVLVVLTLWSERAPGSVPASAPPQEFSAERALGPLGEFATEPRPLGSAADDRARDYLAADLRSAGFSVEISTCAKYFCSSSWSSTPGLPVSRRYPPAPLR